MRNAKSEMESLVPFYLVKGNIYKSGEFGENGADVIKLKSGATGYRLPTNAEWEWAVIPSLQDNPTAKFSQ